ncbi:hypothetical protein TRFO_02697 [Tritrichomonas foetus]|uniref:Importin N-terminal domain-containing protein n=1 Tax=Tritrichomonas foetus TaxID=1144522 RepID=A0A1J4L3A8_9EUKA|nr:hypothetical protein TRFO_02697 [Tritrichomonas foetus]|eukprot:OHT16438.1 hypothetical protein TRFO_02697 [Tritrichomonas foetus]
MTQQDLENALQILSSSQNQDEINNVQSTIMQLCSDPNSIKLFFQVIDTPINPISSNRIPPLISNYMRMNYSQLDPQLQELIMTKLLQLTFNPPNSELPNFVYPILCSYSKNNPQLCQTIIETAGKCIEVNANVVVCIKVVSDVLDKLPEEFVAQNFQMFFKFSFLGLNSNDWETIIPSMRIFFNVVIAASHKSVQLPDLSTQFQHLLGLTTIVQNADDNNFCSFWAILGDVINCNLLPVETVGILFESAMKIIENPEVENHLKVYPLNSLIGTIHLLDQTHLSRIIDSVLTVSIKSVEQEGTIQMEYFDMISSALKDLPSKDVYSMLKPRIIQLTEIKDRNTNVVAISIFSLVFNRAPEAAFNDREFIIAKLMEALDKNDNLLNAAVCIVLDSFGESFKSVDVFALPFIPRIVPFIISPDDELRKNATDALHILCELINVPLPGFFQALWQIKDQVPPDELSGFLPFLATAIEKSDNFGDSESESLRDFIIPFLNSDDYDLASNFLFVIIALIKTNESLMDQLLPLSLNVILRCISDNTNDDATCCSLVAIGELFDILGERIKEPFAPAVEIAVQILNSDEAAPRVTDDALNALCIVAKRTGDGALASGLQEKCINCFISGNNGDDAEEDFEEDEEDEYSTILTGAKCSSRIAPLLNKDDAMQLFLQLHEFIIDTSDSRIASEVMKPITRLLHYACDENKPNMLKRCSELLSMIFSGQFNASEGKDIYSGNYDMFLMTNIAYLIAEFVQYPSPFVDQLCEFMIKIIQIPDNATLYSFIGAYSDVIKYGTGSPASVQAIFSIIPHLLTIASDPDTKQNLAFLLNIIVQKDPASIQNVAQFVPALQEWYVQGKQSPNGHQIMLSNIASTFLVFFANGLPVDPVLLNEAISEFPPFDPLETPSMITNMAKIFSTAGQLDIDTIQNAATALSQLFILNEIDLRKRKITQEVLSVAHQMFVTFSRSNPQVIQNVLQKYQNSKRKLDKINAVLQ